MLDPKMYQLIIESAPNMIWVSNEEAMCVYFNKTWLDFRGRTIEEEYGNGWFEGVHPEDKDYCMNTYLAAFKRREAFQMNYRLMRKDGEYRWLDDRGVPFYDNQGNFKGYVGSCIDITDKLQGEELKEMAIKDGLTGILSRQYFFNKLKEEFQKASRMKQDLSVIMFDIDKFKAINDNYGHITGDKVLKEVANKAINVIREFDLLARYGGDEFIIGLPGTNLKEALKITRRIKKSINNLLISKGREEFKVNCSYGIASYENENDVEELIGKADRALYFSKNNGGNKITC